MTRNIWIVRHAERVDNIDPKWVENPPRGAWDDPPITERGQTQAKEVGYCLNDEIGQIDYLFSSPFLRCLQTIKNILMGLSEANQLANNNISSNNLIPKIFVEPGFSEPINICQNPPGYLEVNQLINEFPMIDPFYKPIISTDIICQEKTALDSFRRTQKTLANIIQNYKGNILIVTHGGPIIACHGALTGDFKYVGQCTISKYIIKSLEIDNIMDNSRINENFQVTKSKEIKTPHLSNETITEEIFTVNEEEEKNENDLEISLNSITQNSSKENERKQKHPLDINGKLHPTYVDSDIKSLYSIECIRAGDSEHLTDRENLRGL